MKAPLKKLFLWSSLGSLFVGATVAMVRRKRSGKGNFRCQKIPPACRRIYVWTELVEAGEKDNRVLYREHYILQHTPFKVWSILELPASPGKPNPTGAMVYHVTYSRLVDHPDTNRSGESENERSRYYGTVSVVPIDGKSCGKDSVARGAILEIRKCYVGGSSNGIETGEVHRSSAPILKYRFEYGPEAGERASDKKGTLP